MKKLAGTIWGCFKETLTTSYRAIGRSVLNYAAPIWSYSLSDTNWRNLHIKQNAALRIAAGNIRMAPIYPTCTRKRRSCKRRNTMNCCPSSSSWSVSYHREPITTLPRNQVNVMFVHISLWGQEIWTNQFGRQNYHKNSTKKKLKMQPRIHQCC